MEPTQTTANDFGKILKVIISIFVAIVLLLTVVAAFFWAQSKARDQIRTQDITLISKFLDAYKMNQGYYPPASNGLPTDWGKYLTKLPTAPTADGSCTKSQNTYKYSVQNNSQGYTLVFCLGSATGGYHAGVNTIQVN